MNLFLQLKSRIGWVVVGCYGGLTISLGFSVQVYCENRGDSAGVEKRSSL